jgi:hypothetical protein
VIEAMLFVTPINEVEQSAWGIQVSAANQANPSCSSTFSK